MIQLNETKLRCLEVGETERDPPAHQWEDKQFVTFPATKNKRFSYLNLHLNPSVYGLGRGDVELDLPARLWDTKVSRSFPKSRSKRFLDKYGSHLDPAADTAALARGDVERGLSDPSLGTEESFCFPDMYPRTSPFQRLVTRSPSPATQPQRFFTRPALTGVGLGCYRFNCRATRTHTGSVTRNWSVHPTRNKEKKKKGTVKKKNQGKHTHTHNANAKNATNPITRLTDTR
jgi:hypothetical protein